MNNIYKILLSIALVFVFLPSFAQFEGILVFESFNAATEEKATVNWYVKNGNHKVDFVTESSTAGNLKYSLIFRNDGLIAMLSDNNGEKTVSRIQAEAFKSVHRVPVHAELKKHETQKISGLTCTRYSTTSSEGLTEFCLTEDTGLNIQDLPAIFRNQGPMMLIERNNLKGLPVDIVMYNNNGELIYSNKLKRVTSQKLADSMFNIPADYQPLQKN